MHAIQYTSDAAVNARLAAKHDHAAPRVTDKPHYARRKSDRRDFRMEIARLQYGPGFQVGTEL